MTGVRLKSEFAKFRVTVIPAFLLSSPSPYVSTTGSYSLSSSNPAIHAAAA